MDAFEVNPLDNTEFSDNIFDFDDLKDKIKTNVEKKLSGQAPEEAAASSDTNETASELFLNEGETKEVKPRVVLPEVNVETEVKKYVIHVDPDNIPFMENLSVNERRKIINTVIREQAIFSEDGLKTRRQRNFIVHVLLVVITLSLSFPILFTMVNKALKVTIQNYDQTRSNFSKLYKEQGKIKRK